MDIPGKMFHLRSIMASAHALAEADKSDDVEGLLIDIQQAACKALGLPEDTDLTDGSID